MRCLHNLIFSPWQNNDAYAQPDACLYPDDQHAKDILGDGFSCDVVSVENKHGKRPSELRIIHNLPEESVDVAIVFFAGKGGTVLGNVNEANTILCDHNGNEHLFAANTVFPTRTQLVKDMQKETVLPVIAPVLDRSGSFGKEARNHQFAEILAHCQEKGIKTLHMTGESMGASDALAFANYALEHKERYNIAVGSVAMAVPFDTLPNVAQAREGNAARLLTSVPPDRHLNNITMLQEIYNKIHTDKNLAFPLTILTSGEKDLAVPSCLQHNTLQAAMNARKNAQVSDASAPIHHINNTKADHFLWDTQAFARSVARAEQERLEKPIAAVASTLNSEIKTGSQAVRVSEKRSV
jgi:hypothetical protein